MRIHRALARAGVASRRHAESMIAEGRVLINGAVALVGQSVDTGRDRVQVDGTLVDLAPPKSTWFVLNKPAGYMTTRSDPEQRRTVFELVPDIPSLTYVGRLDFLTEGVLLLTTDGDAAHRLTHPSAEIERVYVATVRGNAKAAAETARAGVELDDGVVTPAWVNVTPLENRFWAFEIAIREGRTREIRRLCAALGLEVSHLVRTQFGPVRIGQLEPGTWRELSPREAAMLEVFTGTKVPAGKPPRRRDDRQPARERDAGERPRGRGASDRPRERGASDRPRERGASDRPRERGASDRPRERSASDRPRERSASDRPRERSASDRPRERSASDRPRERRDGRSERGAAEGRAPRSRDARGTARSKVSPPRRRSRSD